MSDLFFCRLLFDLSERLLFDELLLRDFLPRRNGDFDLLELLLDLDLLPLRFGERPRKGDLDLPPRPFPFGALTFGTLNLGEASSVTISK
jgi:hypothetical protein